MGASQRIPLIVSTAFALAALVAIADAQPARRDGRVLGHAGPGDLAGLASVLGGSPELFDATVTQPARVIRWQVADLQKLAGADESLIVGAQKDRGRCDRREARPGHAS